MRISLWKFNFPSTNHAGVFKLNICGQLFQGRTKNDIMFDRF